MQSLPCPALAWAAPVGGALLPGVPSPQASRPAAPLLRYGKSGLTERMSRAETEPGPPRNACGGLASASLFLRRGANSRTQVRGGVSTRPLCVHWASGFSSVKRVRAALPAQARLRPGPGTSLQEKASRQGSDGAAMGPSALLWGRKRSQQKRPALCPRRLLPGLPPGLRALLGTETEARPRPG